MEELPEGTDGHIEPNAFRIRPTAYEPDLDASSRRTTYESQEEASVSDRENGFSPPDAGKV